MRGITTAESEKEWKRLANRRWRRAVRMALGQESEVLPESRELTCSYTGPKDGKLVFDQWAYPELSRK